MKQQVSLTGSYPQFTRAYGFQACIYIRINCDEDFYQFKLVRPGSHIHPNWVKKPTKSTSSLSATRSPDGIEKGDAP